MGITPGFNCVYLHNHESGPTEYLLLETTMLSLLTTRNLGRSCGEAANFHFQRPMTLGPGQMPYTSYHLCSSQLWPERAFITIPHGRCGDLKWRSPAQVTQTAQEQDDDRAQVWGVSSRGWWWWWGGARGMVCFLVQSSLLWADCSHLSGFSVLLCGFGHTTQVCAVLLIWAISNTFSNKKQLWCSNFLFLCLLRPGGFCMKVPSLKRFISRAPVYHLVGICSLSYWIILIALTNTPWYFKVQPWPWEGRLPYLPSFLRILKRSRFPAAFGGYEKITELMFEQSFEFMKGQRALFKSISMCGCGYNQWP